MHTFLLAFPGTNVMRRTKLENEKTTGGLRFCGGCRVTQISAELVPSMTEMSSMITAILAIKGRNSWQHNYIIMVILFDV